MIVVDVVVILDVLHVVNPQVDVVPQEDAQVAVVVNNVFLDGALLPLIIVLQYILVLLRIILHRFAMIILVM